MNPTPEHPELDRLSADLGGLLGRIGLAPAAERPERRDRIDIRFAAAAARHPVRIAASDPEEQATYLELNWLAGEIARKLAGRTGPGSAVAVRARRSCTAAGALVGVLRSGAAALPLEPGHHAGLQEFLTRDAGAGVVISDTGLLRDEIPVAKAGPFVIATRAVTGVRRGLPPDAAFLALPSGGDPGRALSVRPVSHGEVLAWVDSIVPLLDTGPEGVWTSFHSPGLDLGMREMWGPLLSGGRAVVVDRDTGADPRQFAELLEDQEVTVLTQLPSGLARLTGAAARGTTLPALRHVLLADEPVEERVPAAWKASGIAPCAVLWEVSGSPTVL
ncbi:AMP-binding protein [Streptomyces sp. G-G2]|uniref:AMP-binding protein n=1 Tax=Streptomyces sp. G-G2 TaxID=3046201 RepID=UPI0024B9412F|nr:AMP-binding protein [Streptomyces sp. G-G2]MDJ0382235.1 AMP-binding protein [Streptomyces sp. G-G2]